MTNLLALPLDVLEMIVSQLNTPDLALVSQVCWRLNELAASFLYHDVHFNLPGFVSETDPLLFQLETFTDRNFDLLKSTKRVLVSGTWYEAYDEIESDLSEDGVVSPAVRMLNALMAVCVAKMPNLRTFIWDAQIAPTQNLVSTVGIPATLEYLQIRVGTNGGLTPFFHPTIEFHHFTKLRSLNVVEVTDRAMLSAVGNAIFMTEQLTDLTIWTNNDAELPLDGIFADWPEPKSLDLKTLDLRGFGSLGTSASAVWDSVTSSHLTEFTLIIGASARPLEDYVNFWEDGAKSGVQLTRLGTNLVTDSLEKFICSFSGLKVLLLMPCELISQTSEPLSSLLDTVTAEHSKSLEVLSIQPQGEDDKEHLLNRTLLTALTESCTKLEEIAFGILQHEMDDIIRVFDFPLLRALHIQVVGPTKMETENDRDSDHLHLRKLVSTNLLKKAASCLQHVAFGDGPVYDIQRMQTLQWRIASLLIGYTRNTVIFREKLFDWVSTCLS